MNKSSALVDWTPEQIARAKKWVETWKLAAVNLKRFRRRKLRELDTYQAIALLCRNNNHKKFVYAPKPWSGLIEMQRLFMKMAERE